MPHGQLTLTPFPQPVPDRTLRATCPLPPTLGVDADDVFTLARDIGICSPTWLRTGCVYASQPANTYSMLVMPVLPDATKRHNTYHAESGEGSLRVQHTLHWREGLLSIEEVKTAAGRRQIHLSAHATEALRQHHVLQVAERAKAGPRWRDHALVFCTRSGGAIHITNFRRRSFLRVVQAAGVPCIRPYDMRHTAATLLLLAGIHPKVVSEMLGHSSVTITLTIYSHVLPMIQRDAATAMNRLLGDGGERNGEPTDFGHGNLI